MKLSEEQIIEALGPDLWGKTCVDRAIAALRQFEPPEGYYLSFSGGKDSQAILQLAKEAGVRYEAHYHWTTCDPPEVVQFIRRYYPDVIIDHPRHTMWELIERKGLPTRHRRWCCRELKEGYGRGRLTVVGVRASESTKRAENAKKAGGYVYYCPQLSKRLVTPIVNWSEEQVWAYLQDRGLPHCVLYDEGWPRIGCVICPMTDRKEPSMKRWPKLWEAAKRAATRFYNSHPDICRPKWPTPDAFWDWWISGGALPEDEAEGSPDLFSSGMEAA